MRKNQFVNGSKKIICFDLEGPLSPQDHALKVMKLIPGGEKIFEVISRYDDLLTLEGKEGYEPGDTLKLIFPILVSHKICEKNLTAASRRAELVFGAKKLISWLQKNKWKVYIISTSYQQHALSIAERLKVLKENVYCTKFPLNSFLEKFFYGKTKFPWLALIYEAEKVIVRELWEENLDSGEKDQKLKDFLDEFFWKKLPETELWSTFDSIKVMGGAAKAEALGEIAKQNKTGLKAPVAVGDSITDFKMLKAVNEAGGLAIVFNGNKYALPYGTVGIASANAMDLKKILNAWSEGEREAVKSAIEKMSSKKNVHWLLAKTRDELAEILKIHQRFRKIVRKSAAKLG